MTSVFLGFVVLGKWLNLYCECVLRIQIPVLDGCVRHQRVSKGKVLTIVALRDS